jgi:hypothetical protein
MVALFICAWDKHSFSVGACLCLDLPTMIKVPIAMQNHHVVFAATVCRDGGDLTCVHCKNSLVLKRGKVLRPHFSHKSITTNCGGGESLVHRATKEWISSNAGSSDLKITATCPGCSTTHTVIRGGAGVTGVTELRVPPHHCIPTCYILDVAFVESSTQRITGCVEVYHTHKAGDVKLRTVEGLSPWALPAVEVNAVNLVESNFPLEFQCTESRKCVPCIKMSNFRRAADRTLAREIAVRNAVTHWMKKTVTSKQNRMKRFLKRWVLLCRVRHVKKHAANQFNTENKARFSDCERCHKPVELFKTNACNILKECLPCVVVPKCVETTSDPYIRTLHIRKQAKSNTTNEKFYHESCSPWCPDCGDCRSSNTWCTCQRKNRRPCGDCEKWGNLDEMFESHIPRNKSSYVCKDCAVECASCQNKIAKCQAKYAGRCFTCNVKRKRPDIHLCDKCDRIIDQRYSQCYKCKFTSS